MNSTNGFAEPLNTPIPPQADESIGVRVYDIDLTAEEMIVRSTLDEIPELHYLRKNTIPIVDDKLKVSWHSLAPGTNYKTGVRQGLCFPREPSTFSV